jgi:HlyD family secretion protein
MMPQHRAGIATLLILAGLVAVIAFGASMMWSQKATHAAENDAGSDKGWEAVAPGRIEPRSGEIKINPVVVELVGEVLVRANDKVFDGEPLVRLHDNEARARLVAAEAQVALRQRGRNSQSASGKAAGRRRAEDAVSEAEADVFDARSAVDVAAAARRAGSGSDAGLNAVRETLVRAQEYLRGRAAALRAIEADGPLPSVSEAQLSIARAERSVARAAVEKMIIRAPVAGTVLQVNVKAGETAAPSSIQPMLLIGDISALRVRAELDERDFREIKIGQAVVVRAAAFPGREFTGKAAFVAPTVEPSRINARGPRNLTDVDVVEVLIDLADPGPLASGMKVDAYFRRDERSAHR